MSLYTQPEKQAVEAFIAMRAADIPEQIHISHAVALLALSHIQERLPQCGMISEGGQMTLTRETLPRSRGDVMLLPQFLFTINWADSGPGISWPETYHATYLPVFDRYIVTASLDGPDMWGVTDLAIGSFAANCDLITGSGRAISAWWAMQRDHDQERFAYVWSEGSVSRELAYRWADEVWLPEIEEEEYIDEPDEPSLPESLLPILAGTDDEATTAAVRRRILDDGDLLLLANGIHLPPERIAISDSTALISEFEKLLPKPQGVIAGMARIYDKLPKLKLRIELFQRITGRLPTICETTALYKII